MKNLITVTSAVALLTFGNSALAQQNAQPPAERAGEPNVNVVQPGQQSTPQAQQQEGSQQVGGGAATSPMTPTDPMAPPRLRGDQISGMIGTDAVTTNNEDIGEIENLLIGSDGQVEAAIVEWGGFLGIGSKTAAVPWNELRMNEAGDRVVIDMTREEMEALPAYTGDPASVAGIDTDAKPVR